LKRIEVKNKTEKEEEKETNKKEWNAERSCEGKMV
jgi:hypothetical protein